MMPDQGSKLDSHWWLTVLAAAAAGGMGWGIRGQYGHETGAMIAGVLVSLVLVLRLAPHASLLPAARAVALGTLAMGFGGSMTYGQTIGLTQNTPVLGNVPALLWGMLGLATKGGLWIGFAGLFLGIGLSSRRTGWREMAGLAVTLVGLFFVGIWLFNTPFDPTSRTLPAIYFSADWHWEPDAENLKPRPEVWGGMLLALLGAWLWMGVVRRDPLVRQLTLWGVLGGALGFPAGQSLQAFHAWNRDWFAVEPWASMDSVMNWWNWMETTFGTVMGGVLAVGLVRNRDLIGLPVAGSPTKPPSRTSDLASGIDLVLIAVHVTLVMVCEYAEMPLINQGYDHGLVAGVLPLVAIAGGRCAPFLLFLPVTVLPIATKTVMQLAFGEAVIDPVLGWLVYAGLPLLVAFGVAAQLIVRSRDSAASSWWLALPLLTHTLTFCGLNFAFFHYPWPWLSWTGRTPNAMAFLLASLILLFVAIRALIQRPPDPILDSRPASSHDELP